MQWHEAVDIVTPHVVRITTPIGSGTGFLIAHSKNGNVCGVATAAHVIDHAHYWEQPIRIQRADSTEHVLLRDHERVMFVDEERDTAAILFKPDQLSFPEETLPLIAADQTMKVGAQLGWLGYPGIAGSTLCFFRGAVSAWADELHGYFVDGVAINGVSGGPTFATFGSTLELIGVVSAYIPNRATGDVLPGLGVVRDVYQFHDVIQQLNDLEEAKGRESPPSAPPPTFELKQPQTPVRHVT